MYRRDLVTQAVNSVKEGSKFQTQIREFIDEDAGSPEIVAEMVADIVTDFRREIEPWVMDIDDTKVRRKSTNNLINDVSRICREKLGHTLVCVSKKPFHKYEAREVNVPVPTDTGPIWIDHGSTILPKGHAEGMLDLLRKDPEQCISWLIDNGHSPELLAEIILKKLKGIEE
jgi:hypothetical protein